MNGITESPSILGELESKVQELSPLDETQKKELMALFRAALLNIEEEKFKYLQLLGLVADSDKDFDDLYQKVSQNYVSDAVDKLNLIGTTRKKNQILKKAFESMGYKLMEQTRAGKKDEVFHSILRLYMTSNQPFDKELLIPFKQSNPQLFKVLIFSFLSGIMDIKK